MDGHGSVRFLTNATGTITDSYDYDAFGILIQSLSATPNNFLYCAEQFDSGVGFYYLRARYLKPSDGRFWSTDPAEGSGFDPRSLHKYTYAANSPTDFIDPSGLFFTGLAEFGIANAVRGTLAEIHSTIGELLIEYAKSEIGDVEVASFLDQDIDSFNPPPGVLLAGTGGGIGTLLRGVKRGVKGFVSGFRFAQKYDSRR